MRCRSAKNALYQTFKTFPKMFFATRAPKQKMIFVSPEPLTKNHFFEVDGVGTLINFI